MEIVKQHLLSGFVVLPLLGAMGIIAWPRKGGRAPEIIALVTSAVVLGLGVYLGLRFDPGNGNFQMEIIRRWIPALNIHYHLAVDGLSLFLVLLTAFLTPLAVLCAWQDTAGRGKEFFALLLLLESGMLGTLLALDTFLFYVFWELMLIPMYFIIGIWGGPRRIYATFKFVLYTMVGSLLMLVCLIYLYGQHYQQFGYLASDLGNLYALSLAPREEVLLFLGFALAFAIKVPMWPLHTWLPDAHVEAPTAGSLILAGVLLKMGAYGFLRFAFPLFPGAVFASLPVLTGLALIGIVAGGLLALVQQDMKKLVAYSSVSHMGMVLVGLFSFSALGLAGGIFQMISHGLSTGALFLLVGLLAHRRHSREIGAYGGIARAVPFCATLFLIVTLSSIGLPGLNGFVGEFLILAGTLTAGAMPKAPWVAAIAGLGILLGAAYLLWLVQRVFFGPLTSAENRGLPDLNFREAVMLLSIVALIFGLGVYPQPVLRRLEPAVALHLQRVESKWQAERKAVAAGGPSPRLARAGQGGAER